MKARQRQIRILMGLLGVWILIEALYASHWLRLPTEQPLTTDQAEKKPGESTLKNLLQKHSSPRVWFAPYTTFPEAGLIESVFRSGVHDTLSTFPVQGISANYGAYRLSPADMAFGQVSQKGIEEEARLASRLGYEWFAIDLGAIQQYANARRLCTQSPGCRISSDGYALFPITRGGNHWIKELAEITRNITDFPQITSPPRWGPIVFHPDQWFLKEGQSPAVSGRLIVDARPISTVLLYRLAARAKEDRLRPILEPSSLRLTVRLAKGLSGADLNICPKAAFIRFTKSGCNQITLTKSVPERDITSLITPNKMHAIHLDYAYGPGSFAIGLNELPYPNGRPDQRSAFSIKVNTK